MNDDIDERYRRASTDEAGVPAESTRRAILAHAASLAAQRNPGHARATLATTPPRTGRARWRRPALFGSLAAAALAGLMVVPQLLHPALPPIATQSPAPVAAAALPARQRSLAADAAATTGRLQQMGPAPAEIVAQRNAAAATAVQAAPTPPTMMQALPPVAAAGAARVAAPAGIDARDGSGHTALVNAVLRGDAATVRMLLARGADPNIAAPDGRTPLQIAVDGRQPGIAAALQAAGAH